jgi:hypothetical protein
MSKCISSIQIFYSQLLQCLTRRLYIRIIILNVTALYVSCDFALNIDILAHLHIQHLKGLSHEIDLKNVDKNLQN